MNRFADAVAKGVLYAALWLVLAAALFRGAVPFLWGSRSDFGMLSAVIVGALGLVGLIWLANGMIGRIAADLEEEK